MCAEAVVGRILNIMICPLTLLRATCVVVAALYVWLGHADAESSDKSVQSEIACAWQASEQGSHEDAE